MQPMGDGLAVLGSRHGMMWDPAGRGAFLVRFDRHPGIPCDLRVGLRVGGREAVLPLAAEGALFEFVEQEITPTAMILTGIDPVTALKVRLQLRIPFLPQDAAYSTAPVYYLTVAVSRLDKAFRWQPPAQGAAAGEVFIELGGAALTLAPAGSGLDLALSAPYRGLRGGEMPDWQGHTEPDYLTVDERLEVLSGEPTAAGARASFELEMGAQGPTLALAWCAYAPPILSVFGEAAPFRYSAEFASLAEVTRWAREQAAAVEETGAWFDGVIADHTLGVTTTHLLAQTLHSWLINTWWALRPESGTEWFSVWEGSCYFHSTVDVEFTQGPFYLALWPELLRLQLDEWPAFAKSGELCVGEVGQGTLFLAHDMGALAACGRQAYPHDMEVEEAADYIILAYAYWRRTGDRSIHLRHGETIRRFLDFLAACDTSGNGVPDLGCTNTIDDASPAIQYGRQSVYLAVKTLAAYGCGMALLGDAGYGDLGVYDGQAQGIHDALDEKAWLGDHYAVTLDPSAEGLVDPWTGETLHGELPGWDAYHIYTANALPLLDMVGHELYLEDTQLAQDAVNAAQKTMTKYGCRHTDYRPEPGQGVLAQGLAVTGGTTGWVSMNVLRDLAAAYRGVDMLAMVERYWDWQCAANAGEVRGFFETFGGNNLCFYPRGVAAWGYFEAAAGFVYDVVAGVQEVTPLRLTCQVPLLALADWAARDVPVVAS